MRSSLGALALAAAVGFAALPARAALPPPTTPSAGVALGRSVGRALVGFRDRAMCAMPLLAARCRTEFDAFVGDDDAAFAHVPGLGERPLARMRSYFATGDPDAFVTGFATIRSATAPAALLRSEPAAAWTMDAGIVDELVPAALHDAAAVAFAAPPVAQMLGHLGDAGPDAALIPHARTAQDVSGRFSVAVAEALPAAIDARYPPTAIPSLVFADGSRGDVVLGLGLATLNEMTDAPSVLALPESQRFLDLVVAALGRRLPGNDLRRLAAARDDVRSPGPLDRSRLTAAVAGFLHLEEDLPKPTLRRVLLGVQVAQLSYNASTFRDPAFLAPAVRAIATWNDADDAYPGLQHRRLALVVLDAKDFAAQRRAAREFIGFLLAGATASPAPGPT